MPAKAPIYLKQNSGKTGNGGGKGAKKLREILSTEMISPPLGDFRHMAHVGSGGKDDMFGDTTFLQKKVADNNSTTTTTVNQHGIPAFHSFRRRGTGKPSKKTRNSSAIDNDNLEDDPIFNQSQGGYGPAQSPILKTAFALPVAKQQSSSAPTTPVHSNSPETKKENNNVISVSNDTVNEKHTSNLSPKARQTSNGLVHTKANGIGNHQPKNQSIIHISDTTSIDESWSLELDLGTSLMDDVMGILDKIEL